MFASQDDSLCRLEFEQLHSLLVQAGTFNFHRLPSNLFPAAHLSNHGLYTGYDRVWIRDNIHVAHAHLYTGKADVAVSVARAFFNYFRKYRSKLVAIIRGASDAGDPMNRPHIRINGITLGECEEVWSHAQNDALGYFIWLSCRLVNSGATHLTPDDADVLALLVLYLESIAYWQDRDSGHWEESRKVEASSIGVVVAALEEFNRFLQRSPPAALYCECGTVDEEKLCELIEQGRHALANILPCECIEPDTYRSSDAALLFLIYPLDVVDSEMAARIIGNVEQTLRGDIGIRRYLGDSFWCANYDLLLQPESRTCNVSDNIADRDALLRASGEEAQWCIFDSILSVIFGRRYKNSKNEDDIEQQVVYFNRALSQLTGPNTPFEQFRCPELYYLKGEKWIPNDVTPLLWSQANLLTAFEEMRSTIAVRSSRPFSGGAAR